jgi:hypothetical protein
MQSVDFSNLIINNFPQPPPGYVHDIREMPEQLERRITIRHELPYNESPNPVYSNQMEDYAIPPYQQVQFFIKPSCLHTKQMIGYF